MQRVAMNSNSASPSNASTDDKGARPSRALVMAGGRSERMRATTGVHKALVTVGGKTLIERNVQVLLAEGFNDIFVAVGVEGSEIADVVLTRGRTLAAATGATITCFTELKPLGTIGAARIAGRGIDDALLVVNVDNLTTLPLRRLVDHHRSTGAALTVAAHREPFRLPFGQLVVESGDVLEYREKPLFPILISSGTYVIGAQAVDLIDPDRSFDVTHLFAALKEKRLKVASFEHDSSWIDVNDELSLRRARELFPTGEFQD
jgi:NDP-mannose synthase